ncbi:hypothetical protein [Aquimarina sp. 2201CG5-10]|uniref:hypothetical protein n=1 Tax=Aquimarina callyspongiae TaxID=3098150 RepID=UPI002AB5DAD1|nr:hypothetical protein [Aquimarina sp. 2201CG5-10]MDY8137075.1 hypothetical protein [Aquimarina sp. 2201CG5-10]
MKKNILLVMMLSIGLLTRGQDNSSGNNPFGMPTIVPPSPTVASLMQFEEVPVENYTGQPSIGIPLFSKNIHQGLSLGLSLQYNTQGIKIDSRSGWTGTGWSLFAGGTISRTVRGAPDESFINNRLGVLHNPDFWNYDNLNAFDKSDFTWNAIGTSVYNYDTELDLYQFSILSASGRFVIVKNGSTLTPKLLSNDPNVKIELDYDTSTFELNSFIVTDTKGYKYYFDTVEYSETISFNGSVPQGSNSTGIISSSGSSYTVRSAWHLSKITTSNDQEIASLTYQSSLENYITSSSRTSNTITSLGSNATGFLNNSYNQSILKPKRTLSYSTIRSITQKLDNMVFRDGTSITFTLGGNHPETDGEMLTDVVIKGSNGVENKRYSFTYEQTDRLWLTQVSEQPVTGKSNVYKLSYTNKNNLAPFDSKSDSWGYNHSDTYSPETIKTGLLSQIQYPTGGVKQFVFEENTYSFKGDVELTEEDYLENPYNANQEQVYTNTFNAPLNITTIARRPTISLTHDQRVSITLSNITNFVNNNDKVKVILSKNNDPNDTGVLLRNETTYLNLSAGDYYLYLKYVPFGLTPDLPVITGNIRIDYHSANQGTLLEFLFGGGVRIKEVIYKNYPEDPIETRRFSYSYSDPINPNKSTGVADSKIGSLENRYHINTKKYLFGGVENIAGSFIPRTVQYDVVTKGTIAQLSKGSYIGYKTVTVSEENNGYSRFTYTTAQDYPTPATVFGYPFHPSPNLDFKRGLLIKSEIYDADNKKLKEVENTNYNFIENTIAPSYKAYSNENCEWIQFYDSYQGYVDTNPSKNIPMCGALGSCLVFYYNCGAGGPHYIIKDNLKSGWAQLKESVTKDYFYDASGNQSVIENKETYEYNPINYQPKKVTKTIVEGGVTDTYTNEMFYAVGNPGYASTLLASKNMINEPLFIKQNKNGEIIDQVKKQYKEFTPGNIIALEKVQAGAKKTENTTTPEDALEDRLIYHKYDSYGNPLEVSQVDGTHIVYIWGYNKTSPIAQIENVTYNEVDQWLLNSYGKNIEDLQTLSDLDNDTASEDTLRVWLNNLRQAVYSQKEGTLVITYTYDPLIGLTSVTDPREETMYYTYDNFNRLEYIKDAQGNILSKNKYHYKN